MGLKKTTRYFHDPLPRALMWLTSQLPPFPEDGYAAWQAKFLLEHGGAPSFSDGLPTGWILFYWRLSFGPEGAAHAVEPETWRRCRRHYLEPWASPERAERWTGVGACGRPDLWGPCWRSSSCCGGRGAGDAPHPGGWAPYQPGPAGRPGGLPDCRGRPRAATEARLLAPPDGSVNLWDGRGGIPDPVPTKDPKTWGWRRHRGPGVEPRVLPECAARDRRGSPQSPGSPTGTSTD
ncbi:hypothetical protein NDU88_002698 [Pleurodeles waltl]|uniref:Uncharacterized protein n=1 Tax=Pleurodeles waltl TaxID=8319 RepID=A0AAV7RFA4_PLEWA|nr:hypothetical protein NDU88_002698 [Pleurodeles waltl]